MFGKLFGAKKEEPKQINVASTQERLNNQVENINMRIKKMEHEIKEH